MDDFIKKLQAIAKQYPSGFTVSLPTLTFVTRGWVVAKQETQNSFGLDGLKKVLEVSLKTSHIMGGWKDGRLFYWDAVDVYFNENEATAAGIANKQKAIYQIETGRLKMLE